MLPMERASDETRWLRPMTVGRKLVGNAARFVASLPLPHRHFCCVCESPVARFLPYTPAGLLPYRQPPFMAAMQTVGSDIENFSCPRCGAHDRERHLLLYLRASGLASRLRGRRILHLAPENHIAAFIKRQRPAVYVMGDLFPASTEVQRVDLEAMRFPDESFDLLIANHVLEHVADDLVALHEIQRVLCKGGHAILQTPYSRLLTRKFEDPGIVSGEARLQAYGQEDHVRLYGLDIFERFASTGLVDETIGHAEALPRVDARRYGVNPLEPLFLFHKPRAPESPKDEC
jgi:SAM-dependent methyltransferase